jgi:subtilisin family serine protease
MDQSYEEMDGNTAISSIAAKMAVKRGVFVTTSAGNYGTSSFPWVGSPADTPEALTLAAVNLAGEIASFSSIGPNGAGYPKPDVAACGSGASVIRENNVIGTASGTSFSSPITCGMVACVLQAAPTKSLSEIMDAIRKSAHLYPNHDIQYGYGIPNFEKALQILGVIDAVENYTNNSHLIYYPNPVNDKLYLTNDKIIIKNVELYDIMGRLIKNVNAGAHNTSIDVKEVSKGLLFVKVIYDNDTTEMVKCIH